MLGREIVDKGVEHGWCKMRGLGLLDAMTIFDRYEKVTRWVKRRVNGNAVILEKLKGEIVEGYEIHKGKTCSSNPIFEDEGCASEDGMVWGTYMHGLFENDNLLKAVGQYLRVKVVKKGEWWEEFSRLFESRIDLTPLLR